MNKEYALENLYPKYKKLVYSVAQKFSKSLPKEDVEDLSQICWEAITRKYSKYDADKSALSTWIYIVCKTTLYNVIRDSKADKRLANQRTVALEALKNTLDVEED